MRTHLFKTNTRLLILTGIITLLLGVQMEGIYSELNLTQEFSWDAICVSAGKITDFGYTVEIAIPFNQLRFPSTNEVQTWGSQVST